MKGLLFQVLLVFIGAGMARSQFIFNSVDPCQPMVSSGPNEPGNIFAILLAATTTPKSDKPDADSVKETVRITNVTIPAQCTFGVIDWWYPEGILEVTVQRPATDPQYTVCLDAPAAWFLAIFSSAINGEENKNPTTGFKDTPDNCANSEKGKAVLLMQPPTPSISMNTNYNYNITIHQ